MIVGILKTILGDAIHICKKALRSVGMLTKISLAYKSFVVSESLSSSILALSRVLWIVLVFIHRR